MTMSRVVYIVDDDGAVRDALAMLVESVGFKARVFASASEFLAQCDRSSIGCLLLDLRMPGMSGLECQERLNEHGIDLPVIFLTGHADVPSAVRALKGGAVDYLEKPLNDPQLLVDRVNECARRHGESRSRAGEAKDVESRFALLTAREREIVQGVATGKANKVIAADLGISERTVEVHRSRAFHKLGIRHVAQLVELLQRLRSA